MTTRIQRAGLPAEDHESAQSAPILQVELDVQGITCRLTLHGELCGTSLAALEAQVDQLGCIPCEQVLVDMRSVTALDEVGANVILGLHHYVLGRGGALRVTGMNGEVAETLRAAGGALLSPYVGSFGEVWGITTASLS